jgi:hypothetical protein
MKPSPVFYLVIGIALVVFVPAWLALRSDAAALEQQAKEAAISYAGYDTLEEQADQRHEKFLRDELGWSEERIQNERSIRAQERVLEELRKK